MSDEPKPKTLDDFRSQIPAMHRHDKDAVPFALAYFDLSVGMACPDCAITISNRAAKLAEREGLAMLGLGSAGGLPWFHLACGVIQAERGKHVCGK